MTPPPFLVAGHHALVDIRNKCIQLITRLINRNWHLRFAALALQHKVVSTVCHFLVWLALGWLDCCHCLLGFARRIED